MIVAGQGVTLVLLSQYTFSNQIENSTEIDKTVSDRYPVNP